MSTPVQNEIIETKEESQAQIREDYVTDSMLAWRLWYRLSICSVNPRKWCRDGVAVWGGLAEIRDN